MSGSGCNRAIQHQQSLSKIFQSYALLWEAHARKRAALRAFWKVFAPGTYPPVIPYRKLEWFDKIRVHNSYSKGTKPPFHPGHSVLSVDLAAN
jgi:hypothetical protein